MAAPQNLPVTTIMIAAPHLNVRNSLKRFSRIKIIEVMLVVALFSIGFGWFADRQRYKAKVDFEKRFLHVLSCQIQKETRIYISYRARNDSKKGWYDYHPSPDLEFAKFGTENEIQKESRVVIQTWNRFVSGQLSADDCASELFLILPSLIENSRGGLGAEVRFRDEVLPNRFDSSVVFDTNHPEFQSFREYIAQCIDSYKR